MKPTTLLDRMKFAYWTTLVSVLGTLIMVGRPASVEAQPEGVRGPVIIHGPTPPMPANPPSSGRSSGPAQPNGGAWIPSELPPSAETDTNEIQLSLQNANIDMVIQWLAQTTGKTVIKSPNVQCQLTIASPSKVRTREAVNLVYSALALQGYTVVESGKSILIVPKSEQLNMSPRLLGGSQTAIPEGRERLMKIFPIKHAQAAELVEKVRPALSADATVNVNEAENEIIISDYNDNLRVAGELIDALDASRPEDVTIRVIALKHMSAQDLAREITPIYQKMIGKNSQETIDVAADDRSNSLLILSSASTFQTLEKIVALLDTEDAQEKIMRTFVLKNADAQDVAQQLQQLNQGRQNNSSPNILYLSSASPPNNPKGVSIVADQRRNAVIVQAPPGQMDGIAKMIEELDAAVPGDSLAPLIYHLKYASASDVEQVLNDLFVNQPQQNRSYYDYYYGYGNSSSDNQKVGRLYGKVRIASEPYSNTLIVTANSTEALDAVKGVINQLDAPSDGGESTLRVGLKFATAATVANDINILFAEQGSPALRPTTPQPQQNNIPNQSQQQVSTTLENGFNLEAVSKVEAYYPWLGGQPSSLRSGGSQNGPLKVSDLVGRVRAVADDRGNAILISANIHYFPQILKLLQEMDAPSDQVSIEARIVEVSDDFMNRLGVRWSPDGSQVFTPEDYDNSILVHANAEYQKGFGGNTTVNSPAISSGSLTQVLTELRSGVLDSTISMDYLIQFLQKTTDATVLGDPQITISDNEMGKLFVGQQVPIPQSTT
ncbi:MAG TPA: secretin N-terminal domain-containing protein, partial [Verrucomicrobiae bacterium]|nr:secretin N-terminal domain-containing protein [Verrucomicrobiae bacterium]